ncbi:MAG TPA: polysaccharide pyruvyl transferase family protein [Allosphingosinicella sp.]|nr:polysaccharide pyruvyl transferase family protein [Allosphingosinicella sp.]
MRRLDFIESQRAALTEAVARFARPGEAYALVGFPDHANVGDSAIWLGARAVLARLTGRAPAHVAGNGRAGLIGLRARLGAGTIYILGGGNFGDLWIGSQRLRERLLAAFPDNRIVQLPQSIHFEFESAAERCAEAIGRHGDFHLMVRDDASAVSALDRFDCPVVLAPDCAFGLGPLTLAGPPRHALLALLRDDKERARGHDAPLEALRPRIEDWLAEPWRPIARAKLALLAGELRAGRFGGGAARLAHYDLMARRRLRRGLATLASGSQAVTDRLHGHILCLLLGIPHVALDNSYGKLSAYHRTWSHGVEGAAFAPDAGAAVTALAALPRRHAADPALPTPARRAA